MKKWKPKQSKYYYTLSFNEDGSFSQPSFIYIENYQWIDDKVDNARYKNGLVFRTKAEAQKKLSEIKTLLKS